MPPNKICRPSLTLSGQVLTYGTWEWTYPEPMKSLQTYLSPIARVFKWGLQWWNKEIFAWFELTNIIRTWCHKFCIYYKLFQSNSPMVTGALDCWNFFGKPSRVCRSILSLPKKNDGIGFPDQIKYQEDAHQARVINWCIQQDKKPWGDLEHATIDLTLASLSWLPNSTRPSIVHNSIHSSESQSQPLDLSFPDPRPFTTFQSSNPYSGDT